MEIRLKAAKMNIDYDPAHLQEMENAVKIGASEEDIRHAVKDAIKDANKKAAIKNLVHFVERMKSQGVSQIEIYVIFETFLLRATQEERDFEYEAARKVGQWVWGYGGDLFDELLDEAPIARFKRNVLLGTQNQSETHNQALLDL